MEKLYRPSVKEVKITDKFWRPYLDMIRNVTMPHVFKRFEETDFFKGFHRVAENFRDEYKTPPFDNGLVYESIRGACDFLAQEYDEKLDARLDGYIKLIKAAQDVSGDGYICTKTTCMWPEWRWGQNGGDIIHAHDLYNHGALIEAGISHYLATGKTTLLECAVKGANLIVSHIGYPPKNNVIPGHSLPEEAFIKLYRLFRDRRELDSFAKEQGVDFEEYLKIAIFWYDNRGNHEGRTLAKNPIFTPKFNQDHITFSKQTTAEGHAVRAALCYAGAAMAAYETGRKDFEASLDAIWDNVANRKLHISGGIGARKDIEGFDNDYNIPHNAYLETCAGIAFSFFNGEMNLLKGDAKYFDFFERSLYNNILASIAEDGTHYFYKNPLISDGEISRWEWHICPCCPPMLLKLYSSLGSYIYSISNNSIRVNMLIENELKTEGFEASLKGRRLTVKGCGDEILIRIPEYAEGFKLICDGKEIDFEEKQGYAKLGKDYFGKEIEICFSEPARLVIASPYAEATRGQVAIMKGATLYCAEGFDNGGEVDFTIASEPSLATDGNAIIGARADGKQFRLIPYYLWCNRSSEDKEQKKMQVWFKYEKEIPEEKLQALTKGKLYADLV